MYFGTLPVELVFEVASYLRSESDINSFALVDHHLYMTLNPCLFKYHVMQNVGESVLIWAAQAGNEALARLLLSYNDAENHKVDPNCKDIIYALTPLSFAAIKGHTNTVKLLRATPGIDLDSTNEIRRTPLSFAAENGHVEIVKLLIMDRTDLPVTKDWARWRKVEPIESLLCSSAAWLWPQIWAVYTPLLSPHSPPLQWMAKSAYKAILGHLLVQSDALEATDWYGRTALCLASESGFETGVELPLNKGAALRPPDRSPVLCALANAQTSIVRMPLERDTYHSLHTISGGGVTPSTLAASRRNKEAVKLLLRGTACQEHAFFGSGWRPLIEAIMQGHIEVVKLLLREQDRRWPGYSNQWQPFFWAAYGGYEEIVRLLLAAEASVDMGQFIIYVGGTGPFLLFDGSTPLSAAAMNGHRVIAELLPESGNFDVNTRDEYGWTPLTWAARYRGVPAAGKWS